MYLKPLLPKNITKTWRILAICDNRQECQVDDFLSTLAPNLQKDANRIRALFKFVTEHGPRGLDVEVSHNIAPEIYQFVKGRIRVAWFYDADKVVICSNGFIKKGQKTPKQEIEAAQQAKSNYFVEKAKGRTNILEE
jgi:phage-related protein